MNTAAMWYHTPAVGTLANPVCVTLPTRALMFVVDHPSAYPVVVKPDASLKIKFATVTGALCMNQKLMVTDCDAADRPGHRIAYHVVDGTESARRTCRSVSTEPEREMFRYASVPLWIEM